MPPSGDGRGRPGRGARHGRGAGRARSGRGDDTFRRHAGARGPAGRARPLDVDARAIRELSLHGTYAYQDRDFADVADVIDRQVDGDRVVTKPAQLRRQELPDPRPFERAVQQVA